MFLLSHPGSYSRRLAFTFASLLQLPYEYISMHRDIGEGELLQQRSLRAGGSLIYQDGPVVRAMKSGSLLLIDGVQRAERNVMPLLNNILENREANLADGTQLVPAARLASVKEEGNDVSRFIAVHPNFGVVALGLPTPPYQGLSLDPPFRSRFQSRWVESHQSYSGAPFPFAITSATPSLPPTAIGSGVESEVVHLGFVGYTPWIWLMSAGLIGEARNLMVTRFPLGGPML